MTLCPDCQDRVDSRDVRSGLYGMGRHSTAHLYAVPVLEGFDAIRECSHCRRVKGGAKGVDELRDATGGRTANIYQFSCGSVAYFAPDAPDFQEAGELKDEGLAAAQGILDERVISGGLSG